MILVLIGVLVGTPILWAVSVGAIRDLRRARRRDPRSGCQAWVSVPGVRGRRYRCAEPRYADSPWCRRHEVERIRLTGASDTAPGTTFVDQPQAVGRALAQARVGIPLALLVLVSIAALIAWVVLR